MSKLDDILLKPLQPIDYELLKRGDIDTSVDVTAELKQELKALFLELIGEDEENYRPYLVVRHKLGLEANQTQARLVAKAVAHYQQELRLKIEEL